MYNIAIIKIKSHHKVLVCQRNHSKRRLNPERAHLYFPCSMQNMNYKLSILLITAGQLASVLLTDSMSLLQKVKSGMGSPDQNVSRLDIHLRKLLWVSRPGHAPVKGSDRADRLAGKATLTNGLLLRRSEVLRSLRH